MAGRPPGDRLVLASAVLVGAVLAGCAAGPDAAPLEGVPATGGTDVFAGTVQVVDAHLDTGSTVPAGGDVVLQTALSNDSG